MNSRDGAVARVRRRPRAGVPTWRTRPSIITATRSARLSASSWSCVTKMAVMPTSRISSRTSARTRGRIDGSRFENGSSSRISARLRGERARERDALLLAARELVRHAVLEARRGRRARAARGTRSPAVGALRAGRRRRSRATFRCGKSAKSWKTIDDAAPLGRHERARRRSAVRPSSSISPASGASKPAIRRSSVVLPQPLGPSRASSSPSRDVEVGAVDGDDVVPKRFVTPRRREKGSRHVSSRSRRSMSSTATPEMATSTSAGARRG